MRAISFVGTFLIVGVLGSGCSDSSTSGNVSLKGSTSTTGLNLTNALDFKLKVYKAAVSTSPLCTNLTTIYENSNPSYTTFDGTAFGSAQVTDGTYPCVVFEVSDTIKFTPAADSGSACVAGTEYTLEVCRSDFPETGTLINGDSFTCSDGEQRMAVYLSTASSETGGGDANPFLPPTTEADASDADRGMKLNGAFTVSGTATATFVVDGTGIVDTNGDDCDMQPPGWGFE